MMEPQYGVATTGATGRIYPLSGEPAFRNRCRTHPVGTQGLSSLLIKDHPTTPFDVETIHPITLPFDFCK